MFVSKIKFGELDAKNEVFQQDREDSKIFFNSYQIPPTINYKKLESGVKYFISGQKGSGKTALMWYLKKNIDDNGGRSEIVLFKSDLTEMQRQKIITFKGTNFFDSQGKISIQYDYKQNWMWFIIVLLAKMIDESDVIEGHDNLHDLKEITNDRSQIKKSIFSGLKFTKIRSTIEAAINTGVFKTGIRSEIENEIRQKTDDISETITMCEHLITNIKITSGKKYCVFFDELELFLNEEDQRNRDLFLIRDLLHSVSRINRIFFQKSSSFIVYASVRSEVLHEVNRVGPEIRRDVNDFGEIVAWDAKSDEKNHPILNIIQSKINESEKECNESITPNIWEAYFPSRVFGKDTKQYLLDMSMYRPRNIVRFLSLSQKVAKGKGAFSQDDFQSSSISFSRDIWEEVEEDLLSTHKPQHVAAIKAILSGFNAKFTIRELESRIVMMRPMNRNVELHFCGNSGNESQNIIDILYRIGAIGNTFTVTVNGKKENKDRWIFRNFPEPLYDRPFIIHESLRKSLQML